MRIAIVNTVHFFRNICQSCIKPENVDRKLKLRPDLGSVLPTFNTFEYGSFPGGKSGSEHRRDDGEIGAHQAHATIDPRLTPARLRYAAVFWP